MIDTITEKEYKRRINAVIEHISKNSNNDISLDTLSQVANYSPFHLQKVFKQVIGETPKQFTLKLRLQNALHLIIIHPNKSIFEIAMDCGFSSNAVFSRAIKNYFGVSPDKIRSLILKENTEILVSEIPHTLQKLWNKDSELDVDVVKTETIRGVYLTVLSHDKSQIQQSFADIVQLAKAHDIYSNDSKLLGIFSPHNHSLYKVVLSVDKNQNIPNKFNLTEIQAGKFAKFKLQGDNHETMKSAQVLFHVWLPESGFKIAGVVGFESFNGNPAIIPYAKLEREFYIPIEPV